MSTQRKTNQELCNEFRHMLTHGFYTEPTLWRQMDQREFALSVTKAWRNDLWKAFKEIERRLCPAPDSDD